MSRARVTAAALAILLLAAGPALAENGAIAYDAATGAHGFSWNNDTQAKADAAALAACKNDSCKIVLRIGPRLCGALATTKDGKGWITAIRKTRDAAKLGALEDCQKRAAGECLLRGSDCNK